ncbi:phage holin family protein [Sphingomicrobium astaxanthinifaciens]|uniref:phage holin family protein n=1 Tax=Sphingomicrobium astaxanthinifaciens TaxID=1227949 RepID=UPI001FCADB7E|nr:phage holin family protein [Sphingomicrobium astaxanthinifaciens]MCJ7422332.1 phage holin family protein [Sphingomicrobium astaxanthinifaciens]
MNLAEPPDPYQTDPDASIGDLMGRVVEDARELAQAEIDYAKAKLRSEARPYRKAATWFGIAAMFAIAAMVAFATGLTLALAALVGPLAGGVVAALLLFGTAGLFALLGRNKLEERP